MGRNGRPAPGTHAQAGPGGGLALLDARGCVTFWSDGIARLTGLERHRVVGKPISVVYPIGGADDGTPEQHLAASLRVGAHVTEGLRSSAVGPLRMRTLVTARTDQSGTLHGFGFYLAPLLPHVEATPDGVLEQNIAVRRESAALSARAGEMREVRAAVAASLDTYRRALDLSPDALLVTDEHGMTIFLNHYAARMVGLPEADVPHKPLAIFIDPADRTAFRQLLVRVKREAEVHDTPLRIRARTGELTLVTANVTLGHVEDGSAAIIHWALRPTGASATASSREYARREIVKASEEERVRVSREIHDVLGQTLTALSLAVKALEGDVRGPAARERVRRVRDLVASVSQQAHGIARGLRPAGLHELGLESALREHLAEWHERTRIAVDFQATGTRRMDLEVETVLYRVAQEVLTNVLRHAGATRVSLVLEHTPWQATMIVDDDGRGFEPEALEAPGTTRLGLIGARERVALIGGTLTVESTPGVGTSVFVRVPLLNAAR